MSVQQTGQPFANNFGAYGAPGTLNPNQFFPGGRQPIYGLYPYSSIEKGFDIAATLAAGAPASSPADLTVTVAAGTAILDGQPAFSTSELSYTLNPDLGGVVVNGDNYYHLVLNPTRKWQTFKVGDAYPTTLLNGDAVREGDVVMRSFAFGEDSPTEYIAYTYYKYDGANWAEFNPMWEKTGIPTQPGNKRIQGRVVYPKVAATNLSMVRPNIYDGVEKPVYAHSQISSFLASPSLGLIIQPASLELGCINLHYYVLPLPVKATFTNGSTSVTVNAAYKDTIADLVASVSNTNTLAIDGAQLAATAYNASTGVLTLGAAYAGTSGTKTVNVTPQTPANIYVRSVGKSFVSQTGNYVYPV